MMALTGEWEFRQLRNFNFDKIAGEFCVFQLLWILN